MTTTRTHPSVLHIHDRGAAVRHSSLPGARRACVAGDQPDPVWPPAVVGSLNLRGRIVTSVDLRVRFGLQQSDVGQDRISIVVEHHGDPYSLIIDSVGEVLALSSKTLERAPATLDASWSSFSNGIYRLDDDLLLELDIDSVLDIGGAVAAA